MFFTFPYIILSILWIIGDAGSLESSGGYAIPGRNIPVTTTSSNRVYATSVPVSIPCFAVRQSSYEEPSADIEEENVSCLYILLCLGFDAILFVKLSYSFSKLDAHNCCPPNIIIKRNDVGPYVYIVITLVCLSISHS